MEVAAAPMANPDQSALPADAAIAAALDRMWELHRSQILERVAVLEAAATAVSAGSLSASEREAAQAAAHKLAGTLGMFNLMRGTDLARELEKIYAQKAVLPVASGRRLASRAKELRAMIENRRSGG
jgi:HPt (histidine-containing phosphotransfer) domain-containing protein